MDSLPTGHPAGILAINGSSDELGRFAELLQSFVMLAASRSDICLRGSATPPPLGYAIRLQPRPDGPGAEIALSLSSARLSTWGRNTDDGGPAVTDMEMDLATGYRWQCLLFPTADSLALTLLQRLECAVRG